MRTDSDIAKDVERELEWESRYTDFHIDVHVKNGNITLFGTVDAYPKKVEAERAAMRVPGITWVNNNIIVRVSEVKSDEEIRKATVNAIKWNSTIDENKIEVNVTNGWVTLEGSVPFEYQRSKARNLAEDVIGVVGVTNLISVELPYKIMEDINN